MSGYISPIGDTSPAAIAEAAFDYLEGARPGWEANPANLETLIIEALAQPGSDTADLAQAALTSVFRYFGKLVNVPVLDAVAASGYADFTMPDGAGYTIDGGSTIGLRDATGTLQGFVLVDDLVIAAGDTIGSGAIVAEEAGTIGNGLSGVAELVEVPGFVVAAFVSTPTENGVDAEPDAQYLDRLVEMLTLLTPTPLLADDWAIVARGVAGVYRVAGVDNLKPGPPYTGTAEDAAAALSITVAPVAADGSDVGATILGNVQTYLDSIKGQNWSIYAVNPQREAIDVTATVRAWSTDTDLVDFHDRVVEALTALLDPARYGAGPGGNPIRWKNEPVLRIGALYSAIMGVADVRSVPSLVFGLSGGSLSDTDVTMGAGSAIPVLPEVGTISVTVTA